MEQRNRPVLHVRNTLAVSLAVLVAATLLVMIAAPASMAMAPLPTPDSGSRIDCISALDQSHVWAGGSTGTYFYNGSSWSQVDGLPAYCVKAIDASHVWVGGEDQRVRYFNGTTWTWQFTGSTLSKKAISGYDASHVWAVCASNAPDGGYDILFYNGTNWSIQKSAATGPGLNGVFALDATHVWAVGDNGKYMFFNGTTWSGPAGTSTDQALRSVSGLDATHVWAVGATSLGGPGTVIFWNGSGWTNQAVIKSGSNGLALWAVAAVDYQHVYAAGDLGTVGIYDGHVWTSENTGSGDHLACACAAQGKYVWIGGGSGSPLLYFDNPGEYNYYFAEGTTREGFEEWLCVQNPNSAAIKVNATYMLFGASPVTKSYDIKPTSRLSVKVNDEVGPGKDVAVSLSCASQFYAERPMYFDYKMSSPGFGWTGGSCASGARQTATDWYFAEGTTREGFEEWLCVQNPGGSDTEVTVNYISAGAYTQQKKYAVAKQSRISVFVNGDVGAGQDVSVHVHCDTPIVVERPMYFNYKNAWSGGHDVMGVYGPRTTWYFAEGTTRPNFDEYLAVSNMNDNAADLTIHFLKTDGTEATDKEQAPANSRWTLNVRDKLGNNVDSSVYIESSLPVVAERPMYFNYGPGWTGGHDVTGAESVKSTWYFAEGCTLDGFDEYICIANPGTAPVNTAIDYMLETGQVVHKTYVVQPKTRVTVRVFDDIGRGHSASARVTADGGIVTERPMYFIYGPGWTGGHDVVGM